LDKQGSEDECFTFLREQLNESSFQWRHIGYDLSILKLNLQVDCAEMRKPAKLFVWFEGRKFLGILRLKSV
jgi:hypothetical protein